MDESEFYSLVTNYQGAVAAFIYHLVRSEEEARDLLQDALIQLWKHRHQLESSRPALTYLYRTALNLAIDCLRRRKYTPLELSARPETTGAVIAGDSGELFEAIMTCTTRLKPKQRAVFILKDIEGFEFTEIAELMRMPVANLRSNLYLARKKIKESLKKEYNITVEYFYDL